MHFYFSLLTWIHITKVFSYIAKNRNGRNTIFLGNNRPLQNIFLNLFNCLLFWKIIIVFSTLPRFLMFRHIFPPWLTPYLSVFLLLLLLLILLLLLNRLLFHFSTASRKHIFTNTQPTHFFFPLPQISCSNNNFGRHHREQTLSLLFLLYTLV